MHSIQTLIILFSLGFYTSFTYGFEIQVLGEIPGGQATLSKSMLEKHKISIKDADPNFPKDGKREYGGVLVSQVLKELSINQNAKGITFIASNQYVTYETIDRIHSHNVLLAFERDGSPLPRNRGGPVMVFYPSSAGKDGSAYNWFIHTIIIGEKHPWELTSSTISGASSKVSSTQLYQKSKLLHKGDYATPRGFYTGISSEPPIKNSLKAISLVDFLPKNKSNHIVISTITGSQFRIPSKHAEKLSLIVGTTKDTSLAPAFGGPYVVYFNKDPQLDRYAPKSKYLYFVSRIELE